MEVKSRNNIIMVFAAFAIFVLVVTDYYSIRRVSEERLLMDTVVKISAYGLGRDRKKLRSTIDKGFKEIERIENLMSSFVKDSDISRVNDAGGKPVTVSEETVKVIELSLQVSELTDGAFDVTLGKLVRLWGFTEDAPKVPADADIKSMLKNIGNENISVDAESRAVSLKGPDSKLDLGGIAKGYAIKRAAKALKENGIKSGLIDAGGDIVVIGKKKARPFRVGIKSPDGAGMAAVINASDVAIVTSGDYERYFMVGDKRYHHILDPTTGYPADKCRSVTIITKDAAIADALSTAIFVIGAEEGIALVDKLDGVEAFIIDAGGEKHVSRGAAELIELK